MLTRDQFVELLRPGLRKDMRDGYQDFEDEYQNWLRTGNMDRAEIELITISGLPRQVERGEGEAYTFIDPKVSERIRKTDTEFGLGYSVSLQTVEDELYGKARQSAKWLGRSVKLAQEFEGADFLDDAFTGTDFTGMFDEALVSTSHELLNSADTWSNQISGNPQLGVTGLQAAFELGENTVDQQGDPIPVRINNLIVNIADEWTAIQLTQNESEPFTSDRNVNATRRKRQLSYDVSHYKDQSGKDWFALDKTMHDSHCLFKVRPQFPDWFEERVSSWFFASRQRFLMYFFDQRGWIGSNAA